ncbi:hypothetical protein SAMN06269185_0920 [Natronoarchaeum philippinense]|uniref:Big-1 domain-containing protein n=1 Tax=Natronoarchaeum philippinense TaxID=558529 RepID=A0A285N875_NATPI|nr:hypothetical protein [Natronoarchaeum philippinense]SNZ05675.1 hypothetical protein SAMN06269185_0920 [Natronoarchaeum philippinense]
MRFRGDDRAVVIQIGAVILLAAIVLAMTGYQATVVPDQNSEIEFNHNQEVHGELQNLRNGIVSTASGGQGGAYSITLGTNYPARALFVNPAPPSGQLRTLGTGQVVIENADATGDGGVSEYWTGANRTVNTTTFAYQPSYNEWDNAPTTIYEHSLLYDAHPSGANTTVTDQVLVDGDEITLVTLAGELQKSSSATASVNVRTVSASTNAISVESTASNPIRLTVPTRSPSVWNKTLGENASIVNNQSAGDYVLSTIELDPGKYDLRMARARVGETSSGSTPDTGAEYLVEVDDGGPVPRGEPTTVVAEVRNRHNNPVSDAEVRYTVGGGTVQTATAGTDGRVRIDAAGGDTVEAWFNASDFTSAQSYQKLSIEVPVGGGGGSSAYAVSWDLTAIEDRNGAGMDCYSSNSTCVFDVTESGSREAPLVMGTDPVADGATVEYAINDTSVAELDPDVGRTDGSGENTTVLNASQSGTVTVYASSGSDGDALDVKIQNYAGLTPTLSIDDVRGFGEYDNTHAYQASIDVSELSGVQTQNLKVRLRVEGDTEGVVYQNTRSLSEISGEQVTVEFNDVDQLTADNYTYTVTADADNANQVQQTGTFRVLTAFFDSLDATVTSQRTGGPNNAEEASEVTFSYRLSSDASGVDVRAEDSTGAVATATGPGGSGQEQTVTATFGGGGQPTDNYPLTVRADIPGGECYTATIQNGGDTPTLANGDWTECS